MEHIDEPIESPYQSRPVLLSKLVLIKHYHKLGFSHLLKQGLKEVRDTNYTNKVPGIFITSHVDQA